MLGQLMIGKKKKRAGLVRTGLHSPADGCDDISVDVACLHNPAMVAIDLL